MAAIGSHRGVLEESTSVGEQGISRAVMPADQVGNLVRELPGLTGGKGELESHFHSYAPVVGEPPKRARTDLNPFDRKEYLSRLAGRF